ncbi:MAG: hypothetical protein R6X27_05170 [Candidatus Desulfacyla sp.]
MFFKKPKAQGSKTPQWRFREMQRGEMNVDPIEGEFFNTEAISSISDALVREAIQNSLDASVGKGPVTVRFSFMSGTEAGSEKIKDLYLSGLSKQTWVSGAGCPFSISIRCARLVPGE